MPQVRSYQRQVPTAPQPRIRRGSVPIAQVQTPQVTTAPGPEAFGAQLGETVARTGQAFYAEELRAREEEREKEKRRQDNIRVLNADRKLSEWENITLDDPQKGLLLRRGQNAFGLIDQVSQDFEKVYSEIYDSLANDDQKEAFLRMAHTRRQDVRNRVTRHENAEFQKFANADTEAYILNAQQAAIANIDDPVRIGTEIERIRLRIRTHAEDYGLGSQYIEQKTAQAVSAVHAGVLERMLAGGQDRQAQIYFKSQKPDIKGDDLATIERALEEGSLRGESQRRADTILRDTENHTQAVDEARKIGEPKLRDEVENRVNHAWSIRKQVEREQREDAARQAKEAIDTAWLNATNIVERSRTVDAIPPNVWLALPENIRSSLRSYAKQLQEKNKVETDIGIYYALRLKAAYEPDEFTKDNLLQFVHRLSESDFKQLAGLQADIRKGDMKEANKVLDGIRSNERIINGALVDVGIDPNDKNNRRAVDKLWESVDAQVRELQTNTGKKATDADIQAIVDHLLMQRDVKVKGAWWAFLPGGVPFLTVAKPAAMVTVDEIARTRDVSLIPLPDRRQIEDALRKEKRNVTDDAILDLYIRTQERLRK